MVDIGEILVRTISGNQFPYACPSCLHPLRTKWEACPNIPKKPEPEYHTGHTFKIREPKPAYSIWQPIETAPKDGTKILIYNGEVRISYWHLQGYVGSHGYRDGWYKDYIDDSDRVFYDYPNRSWPSEVPTHWMPLPEEPK